MHRAHSSAWLSAVLAAALSSASASAQIATDGSVGPAQSLSGPAFSIGSALGTLSGNNLFHSFSAFNLSAGESATFNGPSTLANIVARVTGGSGSSINGTIATLTGGSPNLFLVNPAGVIFGPNASLNVEGSFHVSTADYLKFADGAKFMSNLGNGSSFSTAEPAAFGFLNSNPAGVAIYGWRVYPGLSVGIGSTINIVGGEVQIAGGWLEAPGGTIAATAVASPGEVPLDATAFADATVESFGTASISGSWLNASDYYSSAPEGGSIHVRGGTLTLDGSDIFASNTSAGPGGVIELAGDQQLTIANSSGVTSHAFGEGSGASVRLTGADITINQGWIGTSGDISVKADSVALTDGAISSSGNIVVDVAGALTITGDYAGIISQTFSSASDGDAAQITVNAESVKLADGGGIMSVNAGRGPGTNVNLHVAGALEIQGNPYTLNRTGIFADSYDFYTPSGGSGNITIDAGRVTIGEYAAISTATQGSGDGGDVNLNVAGELAISGSPDSFFPSGILAESVFNATGNAGNISIYAGTVTLENDGSISNSTHGSGDGGNISVNAAGSLGIAGDPNSYLARGIFTESSYTATGTAGNISINAGTVTISNDGVVSSLSWSRNGGSISLNASNITLAGGRVASQTGGAGDGGDITVDVAGALTITPDLDLQSASGFFTETGPTASGEGGTIRINAGSIAIDQQSGIATNTSALEGNGGDIIVNAAGTLLVTGGIATTSQRSSGDTGSITVTAGAIALAEGGRITSSTDASGRSGDIFIEAAGALTITDGTISAGAPSPRGGGDLGQVTVYADSITITGGSINSSTRSGGNGGNVVVKAVGALAITDGEISASSTDSPSGGGANAGHVIVEADSITLAHGGSIQSTTSGRSQGGNVVVDAAQALEIHGDPNGLSRTGIFADSYALHEYGGPSGDAGAITIDAGSVTIGEFGSISSATFGSGQGGDVAVNVAGALTVTGQSSGITANTFAELEPFPGVIVEGGDAGQVTVSANSITLADGGQISSSTSGSGNGGNVNLHATQALEIHGNANALGPTGISAESVLGATGDAGNIAIDAGSVTADGLGQISSSTFGSGKGGDVTINVADALTIAGDPDSFANGGRISTDTYATGDAGTITIDAGSITLAHGGSISSLTLGTGNGGHVDVDAAAALSIAGGDISASTLADHGGSAGTITVRAESITLTESGRIQSEALGSGNGGSVSVDAAGTLTITGNPDLGDTGILAGTASIGNAGEIAVNAQSIAIAAGGVIDSSTGSSGNGGDVVVDAADAILITGNFSRISANTYSELSDGGDGGEVSVNAGTIIVDAGGSIESATWGAGNGGNVAVHSGQALEIRGDTGAGIESGVYAGSNSSATGDAGKITIDAGTFLIEGLGVVSSSTLGSGNGGDVSVDAGNITLGYGGHIQSDTLGSGAGGSVTVETTGALAINGDSDPEFFTGISASTSVMGGAGGQVTVAADSIALTGSGQIASASYGSGNGGNVVVHATQGLEIRGSSSTIAPAAGGISADSWGSTGDAGTITVDAGSITIDAYGQISSNTHGAGKGGDVTVNATGALAITGDPESEFFTGISAGTTSSGDAGQVTVNAGSISLTDSGQIASSTSGAGNGGDITVDAIGAVEIHGNSNAANPTGIIAGSLPGATGDAGQITVHADSLTLTDAGQIATNSSGPGIAGDILIKAQQVVVDNSTISSDSAGTGSSGSVVIDPTSILITNGATVSAKATGGGVSGDVVLVADMITIDSSVVSTESKSGGGGNIQITASNLLYIVNGEVTATVQNGDLDAGNITIYAGLLLLDQSVLSANAFEGKGGNLHVTANGLIASQDSVISASSERGVNGLVDINALSNDVTSGLVELSDALVQDASRLACTSAPSGPQDSFSSVVVHGRGEYDFDPDAPASASYSAALTSPDQTAQSGNTRLRPGIQLGCDR